MRAILYKKYGPPNVLQLKEVEKPIPKDNEILVKVKATTVSVADIRSRSFTVPPLFWLPARITLGLRQPKKQILGMELAGVVESIGRNVKRFKEGDQVFAATLSDFGAYAEYKCLSEDGPVSIKPNNITMEEAAAIPIGARTALFFLRKATLKKGDKILIYGASGSVGSYAVQLAKYFGANVTGVCSTTNLDMVKALGADKVVDYTKEDLSKLEGTYDVIFEAVNKSSFSTWLVLLKSGGTYINVTEPIPSFQMVWAKLTGNINFIMSRNSPETSEALEFIKGLIEKGKLKVAIDRSYPFEEIVEAHRYVEKGHKKGNVIITIK
ncbi:NAD(P)-dependent alcohol dehydrogenase [Fredinandcohnia sp. 179-A 10B2 NHS]|uniref:NAD(P)-dependent alcohol dehydrogenase n=1 Tax=Fredinandcohnia sp. 179-A 10B2 NHS TaxID=3235176 RepID=UPI0039A347E8